MQDGTTSVLHAPGQDRHQGHQRYMFDWLAEESKATLNYFQVTLSNIFTQLCSFCELHCDDMEWSIPITVLQRLYGAVLLDHTP